jgi:hypothetical protein
LTDPLLILADIRGKMVAGTYRITQHAHQEMVSDDFSLDDLLNSIGNATLLENYPSHKRGACCLIGGIAPNGRPIHVVCTTANPMLIIITVYEPKSPKWLTPTQRGQKP